MAAPEGQCDGESEMPNQDEWVLSEDGQTRTRIHSVPRRELFTPCREQCPLPIEQLGPSRRTYLKGKLEPLTDVWTLRETAHQQVGACMWTGRTVFEVLPPPKLAPSSSEAASSVVADDEVTEEVALSQSQAHIRWSRCFPRLGLHLRVVRPDCRVFQQI